MEVVEAVEVAMAWLGDAADVGPSLSEHPGRVVESACVLMRVAGRLDRSRRETEEKRRPPVSRSSPGVPGVHTETRIKLGAHPHSHPQTPHRHHTDAPQGGSVTR